MGDRIEVDRDEWEATQDRLRALEEGMSRLLGVAPDEAAAVAPDVGAPTRGAPTSRRRALIGMAAAGAGAAAMVAGQATPAAANSQGQSFTLGDPTNTATATTGVTGSVSGPVLKATNTSLNTTIYGVLGAPSGSAGTGAVVGDSQNRDGVFGLSQNSRGVAGISANGAAIAGYSANATGLEATSVANAQSFGAISSTPAGVVAQSSSRPGVIALSGTNRAIHAQSDSESAVYGESRANTAIIGQSTAAGTTGVSGRGVAYGVTGLGSAAPGVWGYTLAANTPAVWGEGASGQGVYGHAGGAGGKGVFGAADSGIGVSGLCYSGWGLSGQGRIPLHLYPAATNTLPATSEAGHVWVAGNGTQWVCVAEGQWRVVAGSATAGSLHVLPAPARVYDSRAGTSPAVGSKTKFAANETRTFDLKVNGSTVPAGAQAALVTILLVNASTTAGNATIWANGVAKPLANTMVWGGTAGRFTATATTAVDSLARVQVNASQPTDLVIDVVGFYR